MVVVTLSQQFNIGEKPTVILYTYINRHAKTPEKQQKQKQCSTSSNMVPGSNNVLLNITVVVVSHIQRMGCLPEKTTLHGGQSRSWSAEQEIKKKSGSAPPLCSFGEKLKVMRHVYMYVSRGATQVGVTQISVRLASVHKDSFGSSARAMRVSLRKTLCFRVQ